MPETPCHIVSPLAACGPWKLSPMGAVGNKINTYFGNSRDTVTGDLLAVGVMMGQQRCSQAAAVEVLSRAAAARNQKLRNVAHQMLT